VKRLQRGSAGSRSSLPRRSFLFSPVALSLAACAADEQPAPVAYQDSRVAASDEVVFGLYQRDVIGSSEQALRLVCRHVDWSWLVGGDTVLIKIAANSPSEHPAVTAPSAVRAMVAELYDRGAGKVIVAEQSGVEYVRLAAGEARFSSTREALSENGLLEAIESSGAEAHFFDDQGYQAGYFEVDPPTGSAWSQPLMLPRIVEQVDHIVYLPRLSSHVLAGYTHGLKIAVGWLRDDSRNHLHHDAVTFYEKYAEVNYVAPIRDRFRLAVTLCEAMMLDFGPDTGTIHPLDPLVAIASQSLAQHDALATTVLIHADAKVASTVALQYTPTLVNALNKQFVTNWVEDRTGIPWGPGKPEDYSDVSPHAFEDSFAGDRALARAFELQGGVPSEIRALVVGDAPADDLVDFIAARGQGSLRLV
jgi:uncharacterized protein (DUF362 family)